MPDTDRKEKDIEERGKDVVNLMAIAIKTAQLHQVNNVAVANAIQKFINLLNPLLSTEHITLQLIEEFFHLNGSRIKYTVEYSLNFDFIIDSFKKIGLGTITIQAPLSEDNVRTLLTGIKKAELSDMPFKTLSDELIVVPHIAIEAFENIKDNSESLNKRTQIKKTYANAVAITKGIFNNVASGETINLKKSKRIVATITDQILEHESKSLLLGVTTLKDHDDYTYHHCVNVSILAMAFGHALGLQKKHLAELGLAALFHDLGKIRIPLEILNRPSALTESDWELMKLHPVWGTITILKLKGISEVSMNIAIPSFEHHLNFDLSGYPKIKNSMALDLYSRIIAIADKYDAMTSSRVYSRTAYAPDKVLGILIDEAGTKIDSCLLKMFIRMVGIYPIGSLVMLDTQELGLILENSSNPECIDQPKVLLITDSSGQRIEHAVADLSEKDESGNYIRRITKTLDPNEYGINLAEYLL